MLAITNRRGRNNVGIIYSLSCIELCNFNLRFYDIFFSFTYIEYDMNLII